MSTIKSSAEDLTLNADGSGNDIILQSDGSNIATIDQAGLVTATTFAGSGASLTALPAAQLTGSLPAISGASLTGLTSTQMPAGSVIQVVEASGSGQTQVTAEDTWTDTHAAVTITPSSTSNKIYLSHTAGGLTKTTADIGIRIKRAISGGATTTIFSSTRYGYQQTDEWQAMNWAIVDLDSPSTTSATTYTLGIQFAAAGGNIRHCDSADWNFIAMEIAG